MHFKQTLTGFRKDYLIFHAEFEAWTNLDTFWLNFKFSCKNPIWYDWSFFLHQAFFVVFQEFFLAWPQFFKKIGFFRKTEFFFFNQCFSIKTELVRTTSRYVLHLARVRLYYTWSFSILPTVFVSYLYNIEPYYRKLSGLTLELSGLWNSQI